MGKYLSSNFTQAFLFFFSFFFKKKYNFVYSLRYIIETAVFKDNIIYYGPNAKLYLFADNNDGPGRCIEIVTGLGAQSKTAFTPVTKSLWVCL
jgi:hypothetical protein